MSSKRAATSNIQNLLKRKGHITKESGSAPNVVDQISDLVLNEQKKKLDKRKGATSKQKVLKSKKEDIEKPKSLIENKQTGNKTSISSSIISNSQTFKLSLMTDLLKKFGSQRAFAYLIFKQIADESGVINYSQNELLKIFGDMDSRGFRRMMNSCVEGGLLKIHKEFDSKEQTPRQYQISEEF